MALPARQTHPFEVRHKDVWSIALPATFAFVTEPIAGLVDLTVIGRLGDADLLAGLVLGALAFGFIIAFAFFLRLGTAGLVAQAVGSRDADEGFVHFARAALLAVGIGLLLILLIWPLTLASHIILAPEAGALEPFNTYFGVRLLSAPFVLVNFALLGWFYGRAQATTGMLLQILVHGGNIIFSVLFVYGFGWGVWGVAFGTLIAELIAVVVGLVLVARYVGRTRLVAITQPALLLEANAVHRMFALSRDLMIRSVVLEASFLFFIAQLSREGNVALAGNMILLNLMMFIAYFLDGQAQAAEQLCGKAVGANYRPAFDRALRLAMGWGFGLAAGLCVILLLAGPWLISLMTTAPEVQAAAAEHLVIASLVTITGVMPFVMDGVMTGATLNVIMRNGMIAALALFFIAAFVLQPILGIAGLWLALHVFFIARGVIFYIAVQMKKPALFTAA